MMAKNLICPCCDNELKYKQIKDTHAWICDICPVIMFEYYSDDDIKNLRLYL